MIRRAVDFALKNRFLVLALALLLFVWGAISFHQLPVEAYPDVANNYVEIIAQWPGISAEQMEQQVTIPLEIGMNGIPHVTHYDNARGNIRTVACGYVARDRVGLAAAIRDRHRGRLDCRFAPQHLPASHVLCLVGSRDRQTTAGGRGPERIRT